jgi:oxygen-dependent protoporphyrinogen oxidase
VAVVGGGVTGLVAAFRLAEAAEKDAKLFIDIIDASHRLGGKILTERIDGFLVEGGPDTFLVRKPEGIALCKELGLEGRVIPTNGHRRRSFVAHGGRLHELPDGMSGLVPSRIAPLFRSSVLSPWGKLRAAAEPFVKRRPAEDEAEESVASFVRRRLGTQAYDNLVEPLLCGIHAGDGEQLSLEATAPILKDMEEEYGSILRGLRLSSKAAAAELTKYDTPFVSLAGGMQELVDALIARLAPANVHTNTSVKRIERDGTGFRLELDSGEAITAGAVVLATPTHVAAELLAPLDASAAALLRQIPAVSNAAVSMGFKAPDVPHELAGYGYVVPRSERRRALACSWASSKLPGRAPEGHVLLRVFLGRAGQEVDDGTDDDTLIAEAREELRSTLGVVEAPVFSRVFRYPNAMPQYTLGHLTRVAELDRAIAETKGIFLAGNAYHGVGIPDCIRSGQKAAFKALRYTEDIFV